MSAPVISPEDFTWTLGSLCSLAAVPFDARVTSQQFPPPHDLSSLIRAAQALGFRTGRKRVNVRDLEDTPMPCVAFLTADDGGAARPVLILRADSQRVLYFQPDRQEGVTATLAEFSRRYDGQVVLFKALQAERLNDDGISTPEFGFGWFIPELLKYKGIWRDVLIASLAIQLLGMATPLFTQVIIDKVIVHQTVNTLWVITVAMVIFALFSAGMSWMRQYLIIHTGNRIDAVLAAAVLSHLLRLPARYFQHRSTGVLVARMRSIENIRDFLTGAAVTLLLDLPFMVIFLGIMFYYSVMLSCVAMVIILLMVVMSVAISPIFRRQLNYQFLLGARNQAFLTEYVSGMETVKSLQMEPQVDARYGDYLATYLQASFQTKVLGNTYNVLSNLLNALLQAAILCMGAWIVIHQVSFTVGMLVAFQMFASRLSSPMLRLAGLWQDFQQASIAVRRLGDIMNSPREPWSLHPTRDSSGPGQIEVRDLSFRHSPELPVLFSHLNATVLPGKCIVIMGPSGCGKSTLAKLMLGFYQPSAGQILIDGRDIRTLPANELRIYFGVVPQETNLFSGTIHENLAIANPNASFEEIIEACKQAEIHAVIEKLPQGYQTEVGERGAGLSGGQKQRLAIARALLKRPPVLIFDESTSNLDPATAEHFAATVNQLRGKITLIFITHQLPSTLLVDDIIRLGGPLPSSGQ